MYIPTSLPRYWMLKAASILLKLAAIVMLVVFCGQLFLWVLLRVNGVGTVTGPVSGDQLVSVSGLIDFIIRSVVMIVGAYGGGQLIDLFMSIEESLRLLAVRRRSTSEPASTSESTR